MIAQKYKSVPYVDGGRSLRGADCYGLLRMVLTDDFSVPAEALPEWGHIANGQHAAMQAAFCSTRGPFSKEEVPTLGDVVCVFSPVGECAHVGVVIDSDRGLVVLHTRARHGVSTMPLQRFIQHYDQRVEFWRYAGN